MLPVLLAESAKKGGIDDLEQVGLRFPSDPSALSNEKTYLGVEISPNTGSQQRALLEFDNPNHVGPVKAVLTQLLLTSGKFRDLYMTELHPEDRPNWIPKTPNLDV